MPNPARTIDQAFFDARSRLNEQTGCIEWTRHVSTSGYGTVKHKGRQVFAHRLMWAFKHGEIPAGKIVCHTCDNRRCINPAHLFLGTTQDNVDDKMRKGRFVPCSGERSGTAKLTADLVQRIRCDHRPQRQIALDYGISQSNVSLIKAGKGWAFVRGAASSASEIGSTELWVSKKTGVGV